MPVCQNLRNKPKECQMKEGDLPKNPRVRFKKMVNVRNYLPFPLSVSKHGYHLALLYRFDFDLLKMFSHTFRSLSQHLLYLFLWCYLLPNWRYHSNQDASLIHRKSSQTFDLSRKAYWYRTSWTEDRLFLEITLYTSISLQDKVYERKCNLVARLEVFELLNFVLCCYRHKNDGWRESVNVCWCYFLAASSWSVQPSDLQTSLMTCCQSDFDKS